MSKVAARALSGVVVSNGYGQFHLARLAENLEARGFLSLLLTGAILPSSKVRHKLANWNGAARRLAERSVEVPTKRVSGYWAGELLHQAAQTANHRAWDRLGAATSALVFSFYARWARRKLSRTNAAIYHYRAGYGGKSVDRARRLGMRVICDHSIAHPAILATLVSQADESQPTLTRFWEKVIRDIDFADHVLVNSTFVAETCIAAGVPAERVSVAYTPVDSAFTKILSGGRASQAGQPRAVFAGTAELRKGIDIVAVAAAETIEMYRWTIVGDWQPDAGHVRLQVPPSVNLLAKLPRFELAALLSQTDVFVFPSRAEGSARIVAEAMMAGCWIITTVETGSVVRDGIDGRLVRSGSVDDVVAALRDYTSMSESDRLRRSTATRSFALERLSERRYTDDVVACYQIVLMSDTSENAMSRELTRK